MNRFDDISVFAKYYKAFSDIPGGFDEIKPINVIIGRNNSGKSALIELIEHISAQKTPPRSQHHRNNNAEIFMRKKVGEKELRRVFKEGAGGGLLSVRDHWLYVGKQLIGSQLTLKLGKSWSFFDLEFSEPSLQYKNGVQEKIEQLNFENPFKDLSFHRLEADRDILLEQMDDGELSISPKGHGLTRSLASIIIRNKHPRSLVNNEILGDLNQIFGPDGTFTDILTQEDDNSTHEIYLHEEEKGEIALSNSGSGLKTIILVLAFFHVLPYIKDRDLSEFVFAFEELENNLHPALQRRLLSYIRDNVIQKNCTVFLSTHSNVIIDYFSTDENAQIIHVKKCHNKTITSRVSTYYEHNGVLDDLDVRASDVLQSNGVIWVEGPSDRLYINRWIELWSEGALQEGMHYQCVFYGGRLLAHLSADDPTIDEDEAVKILRVNRNSIILMDSDKRNRRTPVGATKQRIKEEIEKIEGISWITKGREVENYLPVEALKRLHPQVVEAPGQYEDFRDYLAAAAGETEAKRFERNKPLYAERILPYLEREWLANVLDLDQRMKSVVCAVRKWNGLSNS